ncbi:hypothetical protein Bp8pC_147 [Bacillus phage Bp8p-C]|uniref:Uncharacterized protein n=3 Tax=Agatevirus TaxID=1910931 RepID=A0A0A0PLP9_9CAUD|nr:membrane protein [Bacillus phage Bobb]YP_009227054.1 membrane protein [Bacillus phage Bp8p-C]YP_009784447.1 hypothetical protein QLX39_gp201 [Bacillus phage Bp8p-T]AHJ87577.1 hypothetical protein Bp8pC_147 [Bacillus phage Bp8p-C]AHJ87788.1 hypothetical protein Bp8pT_147 [Bacillus phage Bp8p-T]AII28110.1 hypothetical protein [Bacillus phage Bobb]
MLILATIASVLLYASICYLTFFAAAILFEGIKYALYNPIIKSATFIGVAYISIISDVILFDSALHSSIIIKNAVLLSLALPTVWVIATAERRRHED